MTVTSDQLRSAANIINQLADRIDNEDPFDPQSVDYAVEKIIHAAAEQRVRYLAHRHGNDPLVAVMLTREATLYGGSSDPANQAYRTAFGLLTCRLLAGRAEDLVRKAERAARTAGLESGA